MRKKRITIEDVALEAGVHASTVSRALNPGKRALVSDVVAARVAATAQRLGYTPDPVAAGLRTRRSATIGILIPDIANPLFPPILRGIEAALAEAGYTAIIANTDNDALRARDALERLAARRVDGVILATVSRRDPLLDRCRKLGLPVVLVNRSTGGGATSAVLTDDEAGAALAVRHLALLGHRAIGHVAGPQRLSTGAGRRSGFVAARRAIGGESGPPPIAEAASYGIEAGAHAAAALLAAHPRITAIVAANDLLALGCYDEARRRGLACPRDISITGFNDMPFADRFDPPLTTVRIAQRAMGVEAARLLLAEIENPRSPKREIKLQPELVVRGSTAQPRGPSLTVPRRSR
ncbi:MAG: LacI family DNA-binding transcriptional regulator [Betaproteobacteria bacterium]|nr:LacI family DNA-binding transcriptional regulator [Betaproteobacteria bacterium]MDE2208687.1 LacI family DNA-binding transcriptional regulator [Betaproteobacteria bacterium]